MQLAASPPSQPLSGHAGTCSAVWDERSRLGNSEWMDESRLFSVGLWLESHSQTSNVLEEFTFYADSYQDPSRLLWTPMVLLIVNKPRVPYGTILDQPQGMCPPHQWSLQKAKGIKVMAALV